MRKQVFSLLVNNNAGLLSRVAGLFSRRGYNIDSITSGATMDARVTRITVVASGDEQILSQIKKQLAKLEDVLDSSKAVPFSNKVSVDKEEIYDIISEIRMKLPNELKQSKWVIEERNKILIDAQREADEIVKNAEDRMVRMIDDNEVTKRAYEQAAAIIDSAKKTSKEMRLGAVEYAEGVLADAEGKLKELKAVVYSESIKTDDYFAQTLNVLAENIQELRMGK